MNRRTMLSQLTLAPLACSALGGEALAGRDKFELGAKSSYFPNLTLRNQDNKQFRFYDDLVRGKIVTFNFMYADCEGRCPLVTSNLVRVQEMLGKRVGRDIFMYSITLKPEADTPRVLKDYARMHRVKEGWQFLTGHPDDIETIRRKLGLYEPDPAIDANKNQHTVMIRFGNDALDRWCMCPAVIPPEAITRYILFVDWPKNLRVREEAAQRRGIVSQRKRLQESHRVAKSG